ncbi:dentin sialophosphoprotein-like [Haliotis rubra]|uniref:dentin sialophosphoprotein-like n=1 Tax=Haliotis rubra TaxID=36100 RepID=UPI001EE52B8A|nr:dentin sialophosphoprotein-like [Haliotis rubra]
MLCQRRTRSRFTVNEEPLGINQKAILLDTAESKVFVKQGQVNKEQDDEGRCSLDVIPAIIHSNVSQLGNDGTSDKQSQPEVSGVKSKIYQKIEIPAKPEKNYPSGITEGNKMQAARIAKPEHNPMLPKTEHVSKEDGDICKISQGKCPLNTAPGVPSEVAPRQLIDCTEKEMRGPISVGETTDDDTEDSNESSSGSNTLTGSDASNITVVSRKPDSPTTCVKVEKWLQTCDKSQPKSLRVDTDDVTSKTDNNTEQYTKDMTVPCEGNHSEDVPADLKMDSLQNGQLTPSTTEEENYSIEKSTTVAVDEVKQKDKAICTLNDSHSSDPVLDADRPCSTTDHSNKNKEQTMKQADHIDIPDHTDDIAYREISNGKKHVVSSVDVTACDKSTSKDTVKNENKTDVFSSAGCETVARESNAIATFEERIPENTGVPSQEPTNKNKRKTRKKKKKKKTMATDKQTSEATLENDGHGMNINNENVDKEKSVISETPQEEKIKMVKSVAERPVLTVSECKSDILEMIQNSSCSILESISAATEYGLAENTDSRKEEAETAGEERGGDDMGILDDVEDNEGMEFKPDHFDNLPWEVEFTADAWKHLRSKSVQMRLKQRAVKIITELANGNWRPESYKPASTSTTNIFTSELSKTTSLIWEKAVAFSGRCSDSPSKRMQNEDDGNFAVKGGRIYTQIIRVWDIVSSDDDIQTLLGSIRTSYKRGKMSLLTRNLQGLERSHHTDKQKQLPLLFAEQDMRVQETITCMFFPQQVQIQGNIISSSSMHLHLP